ncbi:MAG: glutamate racemase [Bacteroidota bacterium]|jgi:glutamate racemase
MNKNAPIGIFDSGYGGLTVFEEVQKLLPEYDYLYFGDNARAPYGNRSFDVVYEFTLEAVQFLFDQGCPLVVLACNTASAKALRTIQQQDLPNIAPEKRVLGVIRPSTEEIGFLSKNHHVGVLGTTGTIQSNSYVIELKKFAPDIHVTQHACPMWVPLIENEKHLHPAGIQFIEEDVRAILAKDPLIDTIILACTHYPVIKDKIQEIAGKHINIVSQGPIVAEKLKEYLVVHPEMEEKLTKNGSRTFYSSESSVVFNEKAERFLGYPVASAHHSF